MLEVDGHVAVERDQPPGERERLLQRVAGRVALADRGGDAEARRPDRGEARRGERRAGHRVPGVGEQQRVAGPVQVLERRHRSASASARAWRSPGHRRGPSPNGRPARLTSTSFAVGVDALRRLHRERLARGSARPSPRTPARASRPAAPRVSSSPSGRRGEHALQRLVGAGRVGPGPIRGGDRAHVVDEVDAGVDVRRRGQRRDRRDTARRSPARRPRLDAVEQCLGDRAPPRVRLAVREPRHRGAQPRHRAERTGRTRRGNGIVERSHALDGRRGTFRRRPKRRGPTLSGMSELADVAALLADRTRARILEELLGGAAAARGRAGGAGRRRALDGLRAPGEARGRRPDRRALRRPPPRGVTRAARGRRGAGGARRACRGRRPGRSACARSTASAALREARSCYDHLAGRAGVALADSLVARGALSLQRRGVRRERLGAYFAADVRHRRRCVAGAAARWCARAWTGPSGGRTWRARSARRCST